MEDTVLVEDVEEQVESEDFTWVEDALGEDGLLAQHISNYKPRPQQILASKAITMAGRKGKPLLLEAPTGVGKSLASLIPGFEIIKKENAPVVVVTSSIVLQEQYMKKDVPLLEKIFNMNVSPVLIKGRSNFTCPKKINELMVSASAVHENDREEVNDLIAWERDSDTGDISELTYTPSYSAWKHISCVEQSECERKDCAFYDSCPYYKNRQKVKSSKLIITNYHYFFYAMQNEDMLPPGIRMVIFDEGHEMATIARDFQETDYTYAAGDSAFRFIISATKNLENSEKYGHWAMDLAFSLGIEQIKAEHTTFVYMLKEIYEKGVDQNKNFHILPYHRRQEMKAVVTSLFEKWDKAYRILENYLEDYLPEGPRSEWMENYEEERIILYKACEKTFTEVEGKCSILRSFLFEESEDILFWIEPREQKKDAVRLVRKPTTGRNFTASIFENIINPQETDKENEDYPATSPVPIVMSATLASGGQFSHVAADLGCEEYDELIVDSPFNLSENLLWYLPMDCPGGTAPGHREYTIRNMAKIIQELDGRSLCLFTSVAATKEAATVLKQMLPFHIRVISQFDMPRNQMIEALKDDPQTVLVGTRSLFTGIDIQGQNLSAVMIDKIPFPMLGDAVNDTLINRPGGFRNFSLPEAIITLKQGLGRLNRTADDKGIFCLFDGRLSTARYKNTIFNSFQFQVQATREFDRVREFCSEIINESKEPMELF